MWLKRKETVVAQGVHADVDEIRQLTNKLANAHEAFRDMRTRVAEISLNESHFGAISHISAEAGHYISLMKQVSTYLDNAQNFIADCSRLCEVSASLLSEADESGAALLRINDDQR